MPFISLIYKNHCKIALNGGGYGKLVQTIYITDLTLNISLHSNSNTYKSLL